MKNRSILQLCKDSQRMPRSRKRPFWWDQDLRAPRKRSGVTRTIAVGLQSPRVKTHLFDSRESVPQCMDSNSKDFINLAEYTIGNLHRFSEFLGREAPRASLLPGLDISTRFIPAESSCIGKGGGTLRPITQHNIKEMLSTSTMKYYRIIRFSC